ncbi:MAG: TlpA disulfide reductase family protein [Clostridiales Family XIII bacterium]|nr:TlpA family protein disulfide reductase [Clostridia bacterium]MDY3012166.1 TlpA disulfide reductase family protein [Clostridiales Family XIII bacterium]
MKRKKGKLLFAVMILAVTVMVLSACGDQGGEDKSSGDQNAAAQPAWTLPEEQTEGKDLTSFKTLDLTGTETDQSVFANYKYTLIDVWGTYCNPCIRSMPDNEKLYQAFKDKGLGVMGIVVDALDQSGSVDMDQVDYAKELLDKQGVTYPVLLPSEGVMKNLVNRISVIPSYIFVDSKGNITSTVYEGGRSYDEWVKIIEEETGI